MADGVIQRRVGSGMLAELRPDRWRHGAVELIIDGTPQSHVCLDDPTALFFEYVQRMGHVIDLVRPAGQPITAVHLGAGALTLPRYIGATRPGSRQQVIELDRDLVDLVREELPWDRAAGIRVRYGDARATLARLPAALRGTVDVLVVDVFAGAQTPAHVTSGEFYREAAAFLAPDGVLLVNVADGPPMPYARSQAVTVGEAVGPVLALAETGVLKGRRFGNVVLAAVPAGIPNHWHATLLGAGPYPAGVLGGEELQRFTAGARAVDDATATGSPAPGRGVLRFASD
ncbi:MAG TPA: fused MFS/spermidine synthase [Microbacteriaceae bacterium]|nr:fused MFS/spermidine synthase [Microbacteriaceae bacterium]